MKTGRTLAIALGLTCILGANANAALTWNNGGPTNNWSTAAGNGNWLPGNVLWTNGEDAIFGATPEAVSVTTANTVDDITFQGSWTIGNGIGSLTLADSNSDITVDPTFTATIQETIAGTGFGITKLGTGTLVFTNNLTYTGTTNIDAGMLQLNSSLTSTTTFTVNTGGTLRYNASTNWAASSNAITLNGGTLSYVGSDLFGRYVSGVGPVAVNSASSITVSTGAGAGVGTNASSMFIDGALTGSAALSITSSTNGKGVILRSGSSTYSGTITVTGNASATAGTGSGLTIGVGSNSSLSNADIVVNGMLELGNAGSSMSWGNGAVSGTTFLMDALGGTGVVVANLGASGTRTLSVGNNNGGDTFSGVISNGANNTGFSLIKNGDGTQRLSGLNTYSGTTTINGGTLLANTAVAGTNSATGTGAVTVGANGTLGGIGQIRPGSSNGISVTGTLAPGESIGTLTIDGGGSTAASILTMNGGSLFEFELGAPGISLASVGTSDRLVITNAVTGDVTFNNNDIDFLTTGSVGYYKLFDTFLDGTTWSGLTFDGTSGIVSTGLSVTNLASGLSGTLIVGTASNGGDVGDIYLHVVPEPSSLAMLAFGLLSLWMFRKQR